MSPGINKVFIYLIRLSFVKGKNFGHFHKLITVRYQISLNRIDKRLKLYNLVFDFASGKLINFFILLFSLCNKIFNQIQGKSYKYKEKPT